MVPAALSMSVNFVRFTLRKGYEAKPVACQQYPFIYYKTPRGLEVFLDHSCPEVIQNNGEVVTAEEIQNRISQ